MITIRLQRVGRRNDPAHRVVVQDSRKSPKSGRVIEILGSYNPRGSEATVNTERASYWVAQGAHISGTVHNILVDQGVVAGKKNVLPRKQPIASQETQTTDSASQSVEDSEAESTATAEDESGEQAAETSQEDTEGDTKESSSAAEESEQGEEESSADAAVDTEQAAQASQTDSETSTKEEA